MTPVRAAGGVLVRDDLIALVHRPRYNDWTLPKGKLERGEHPLVAACREVWEETGVRPVARTRLPTVTYPVRTSDGSAEKTVEYWVMAVDADEGFTPNAEIDDVAWLPMDAVLSRLSYPHDVEVVSAYAALPVLTGFVVLARHTHAGKRGSYPGPDAARPLDPSGRARAAELAPLLAGYGPQTLVSAPPRRCVQTLGPLASTLDLPIGVEAVFEESADPGAAAARIRQLAAASDATVVCSQGGLIPATLTELTGEDTEFPTPKGTGWVLSFAGPEVSTLDFLTLTA